MTMQSGLYIEEVVVFQTDIACYHIFAQQAALNAIRTTALLSYYITKIYIISYV